MASGRLPCRECAISASGGAGHCGLCELSNKVLDSSDEYIKAVTKRTNLDNAETSMIKTCRVDWGKYPLPPARSETSIEEIASFKDYIQSCDKLMNGIKNSLKKKGGDIAGLITRVNDLERYCSDFVMHINRLNQQHAEMSEKIEMLQTQLNAVSRDKANASEYSQWISSVVGGIDQVTMRVIYLESRATDVDERLKYEPERFRPINIRVRWLNGSVMNVESDHIDSILDVKNRIKMEGYSADILIKNDAVLDDTMMVGDVLQDGDIIDGIVLRNQNMFSIAELRKQIELLTIKVLVNERRLHRRGI